MIIQVNLFSRIFLLILLLLICNVSLAQGSLISYYYHPSVELSWVECYIYHPGGSEQKIPFFTVANQKYYWATHGTKKYFKDVDVDARIVFIGNGIVKENEWDSYISRRKKIV